MKIDSVGQVITKHRKSRGLSIRQLADAVGWDKARVSRYENNIIQLSLCHIDCMAKVFGVNPKELAQECVNARYGDIQ